MKVVIPGGSGQVGAVLGRHFAAAGHEVVVLSRTPGVPLEFPGRAVGWDARTVGPWAAELAGAGAVVNLAGRSVNCRYTAANRALILDSRVDSTRAVGAALAACPDPPRVWLQASTATIYDHTLGPAHDELTGAVGGNPPGSPDEWRFSTDVALRWERAALDTPTPRTRLVLVRSAVTLSPDPGGVFSVLLGLVRRGLGGTQGSGEQFVSWLHDADFCRAVDFLLARDDISGPVNLSAPEPVPNREFMRDLRRAAGVPVGLPAARWMLAVGARLMRTETELILKSRRVVPGRLLAAGFAFTFPHWPAAAADLVRRWRARPGERGV